MTEHGSALALEDAALICGPPRSLAFAIAALAALAAIAAISAACGDGLGESGERARDVEDVEDVEYVEYVEDVAPPSDVRFLIRDGIGNNEEALRYYASLDGMSLDGVDVDEWRAQFMGGARIEAFYRNTTDLGFWRELSCSVVVDRGIGGCAVSNWAGPDDKASGAASLGTVAMRIDDRGRLQFYAFAPDGTLSTSVRLDDEGDKFVPMACTVCHGGAARVGEAGGLGATFRELEPSLFELPPGADPSETAVTFRRLNGVVAHANERLKREDEGAPPGADAAANAVVEYVEAIYAGEQVLGVDDEAHVPQSWRARDTDENDARTELWRRVVNPYCMGCHRTSTYDFTDYELFSSLRDVTDGVPELRRQLSGADGIVMPQSQLTHAKLAADDAAQRAVDRWLAPVGHARR